MDLGNEEKEVLYLWIAITSISKFEKLTKQSSNKKEEMVYHLRSLDKIEFILDNTDWSAFVITKNKAIQYLQTFHVIYTNTLIG